MQAMQPASACYIIFVTASVVKSDRYSIRFGALNEKNVDSEVQNALDVLTFYFVLYLFFVFPFALSGKHWLVT